MRPLEKSVKNQGGPVRRKNWSTLNFREMLWEHQIFIILDTIVIFMDLSEQEVSRKSLYKQKYSKIYLFSPKKWSRVKVE